MLKRLELIRLAAGWRTKAANTQSPEEAATLQKCADQLVGLLNADAVEIKSRPVAQAS